jgi:protoheme IX farnesyltransferase
VSVNQPDKNSDLRIRGYLDLMKLRVVELLLVTTLPALVLAQKGIPSVGLSIATILGGTLAAGSANAFNMVIESETDKLMKRTAQRPIAIGTISRSEATIFATIVGLLSLLVFWLFTTPLATWLTFIAIVFYVVIYTMALKRRTSQNIVWGGIAGCMPVLIGWAAVTNDLSSVAWAFFFVIFFWTPPHFWALAIKYKDDYNAAGIPMLPGVTSQKNLHGQMWFHTIAMFIASVVTINFAELSLWVQIVNALLFCVFAVTLAQLRGSNPDYGKVAAKVFQWSITYLSLYSVLLVAAVLI